MTYFINLDKIHETKKGGSIIFPLNLYLISQIDGPDTFSQYATLATKSEEEKKIPTHEQESLRSLIFELKNFFQDISTFDGFFYNYQIPHISKEFDLIKISSDYSYILNIELKSHFTSLNEIREQLIQNKYYLHHLASDEIDCFTYISNSKTLYFLNSADELIASCISTLSTKIIKLNNNFFKENINNLFKSYNFLVSPLNTPEKFINNEYFLTEQQKNIKNEILKNIQKTRLVVALNGAAGTGKTLLLYDLAKELSVFGKVLVLHCGILPTQANKLQESFKNINLSPVKFLDFYSDNFYDDYKFILIDESQRIYKSQFTYIEEISKKKNIHCIFSLDPNQTLSQGEENVNISKQIFSIATKIYTLSEKIRTNKALAEFIKILFNLNNSHRKYKYNCVDVVYASNMIEAYKLIDYYKSKDYTFINFTSSNYKSTSFDFYNQSDINTHQVIGQEFTNVLMILNDTFFYDENNILRATEHPNPNYLYKKLLLQGITRTRENLCIIIVENLELFKKILSIKISSI